MLFPHEVFRSRVLVMLQGTSMWANHTLGSQYPLNTGDYFIGQHRSSLCISRQVFSSPAQTAMYFSKSLEHTLSMSKDTIS